LRPAATWRARALLAARLPGRSPFRPLHPENAAGGAGVTEGPARPPVAWAQDAGGSDEELKFVKKPKTLSEEGEGGMEEEGEEGESEEEDEDDGPSFEFRFECAKLLLELDDTTTTAVQVRGRRGGQGTGAGEGAAGHGSAGMQPRWSSRGSTHKQCAGCCGRRSWRI
jgi:hypothetical protein